MTFEEQRETLKAALLRERQREAMEAVTSEALSGAAFRLTADGERKLGELSDAPSAQAVP
jgi:hypothetical protein